MKTIRIAAAACLVFCVTASRAWTVGAQTPKYATILESDLRQFLAYLSSDQLLGRQTFTEGYGLAAGYIAARLEQWGVKPLGENGTYFQTVALNDVKTVTDASSVTVEINGRARTFKNGENVRFAAPVGGRQTLMFDSAEFIGYGLFLAEHDDYAGRNVRGKPVIFINAMPSSISQAAARVVNGRGRHAVSEAFASAVLSYSMSGIPGRRGGAAAQPAPSANPTPPAPAQPAGRRGQRMIASTVLATPAQGDFTSPDDLNKIIAPQVSGDDEFFSFLFSDAPHQFAELRNMASRGEPLPGFTLSKVTLTFNVDTTYEVLQTLYTHNVVGMIEGTDPRLKDTYVLFGAHLDHIGYAAAPRTPAATGAAALARCPNEQPGDVINNGADDDGSGTAAVLAIAKAFATGPKARRSLVFIWHAGEEMGLYGSRYSADHPVVPLDRVSVQLNMDMIGRDDWDDRDGDYSNSMYLVGDDRISTELHNIIVDVNAAMKKPLKLDYGMNDPLDPEAVYYRSDHYSYASKGIPIAFFTTGLHTDYHCRSDTADKIRYEKMTRIGQLAYETGFVVANMPRFLERDNRGPRAGKGFQGKIN